MLVVTPEGKKTHGKRAEAHQSARFLGAPREALGWAPALSKFNNFAFGVMALRTHECSLIVILHNGLDVSEEHGRSTLSTRRTDDRIRVGRGGLINRHVRSLNRREGRGLVVRFSQAEGIRALKEVWIAVDHFSH